MKRKTSTVPTRIWTYGCLPPIEGGKELDEQLFRAHRYRNGLVEIERRRRQLIAAEQSGHDVLGELIDSVHALETALGETRLEAKRTRSGQGDADELAVQREVAAVLKGELKKNRAQLSLARKQAREDVVLKQAYEAISEQAAAERKLLRNSEDAPYWGTYLVVEKATETWAKLPDAPRFLRYAGEGRVAVQLQKGLTVAELESDTQLRIMPGTPRSPRPARPAQPATAHHPARPARPEGPPRAVRSDYRTVWIRVKSDEKKKPVWAKLPFVMHRELPADARIMWAWIIRRRWGERYKYELQLTIESETFVAPSVDPASRPFVAVDIGSRDLPTGEVRSALWTDSRGASGEVKSALTRLSSPTHRSGRRPVPNDLKKVESLRGIRDKNLDAVTFALSAYKVAAGAAAASPQPNPALDWLREAADRVTLWRSPARVRGLLRKWQRHEGDAEIYEMMTAYIKQDRHLSDWESHERSRYLKRRRAGYRDFAAHLARTYSVIVLAKRDYRRAASAPEDAVDTRGMKDSRAIMRGVAPGDLRSAVVSAAKAAGVCVVEIPLEGDTAWALDRRVCERLLASAEVVQLQADALEKKKPRNHVNSDEPWGKRRLGTHEKRDPLAGEDVTS